MKLFIDSKIFIKIGWRHFNKYSYNQPDIDQIWRLSVVCAANYAAPYLINMKKYSACFAKQNMQRRFNKYSYNQPDID